VPSVFCGMRITEDVRRYTAGKDEAAIKQRMVKKTRKFTRTGGVYERQ